MECPTDLKKDAYKHTWTDRRANFSTLTADAGAEKTVSIDVKMHFGLYNINDISTKSVNYNGFRSPWLQSILGVVNHTTTG